MKQIENRGEALGISKLLMRENAGAAVARYVIEKFSPLPDEHIVIVCGTGNNVGDSLACARHRAGLPASVEVFLLGSREQVKTAEAKPNLEIILRIKSLESCDTDSANFSQQLEKSINKSDIIIDTIFGTGVRGNIKEPYALAIRLLNQSKAYREAVELPSGLDPATGNAHDLCVKAHTTITFHAVKKGLIGNKEIVGEFFVPPNRNFSRCRILALKVS